MFARAILLALSFFAWVSGAQAAASDWIVAEGGRVRLVVKDAPEADGTLRGALQIDLKPGWKTYWRDPGGAGVPPAVTFSSASGVNAVRLGFPPPESFGEGEARSIGYHEPVSLAVTLTRDKPDGLIAGSIFVGICEEVCIPVQADFTVDLSGKPASMFQTAVVDDAFAALPKPAGPGFGVVRQERQGDALIVEAYAPGSEAELFLAGDSAWQFGPATAVPDAQKHTFRVPILRAPRARSASLTYALRSGGETVEGIILPPAR